MLWQILADLNGCSCITVLAKWITKTLISAPQPLIQNFKNNLPFVCFFDLFGLHWYEAIKRKFDPLIKSTFEIFWNYSEANLRPLIEISNIDWFKKKLLITCLKNDEYKHLFRLKLSILLCFNYWWRRNNLSLGVRYSVLILDIQKRGKAC